MNLSYFYSEFYTVVLGSLTNLVTDECFKGLVKKIQILLHKRYKRVQEVISTQGKRTFAQQTQQMVRQCLLEFFSHSGFSREKDR